jgi:hypothetical protein
MLIHASKDNNILIARLDCTYDTSRFAKKNEQTYKCMSHFDHTKYLNHTDIYIGARVAISTVYFLPEVGLYNGTIGLKLSTKTDQWDQMTNNITACQTTL